jgi:TolB-like protein/DNA-binding SARP family transcriptional activator
MAFSVELHVLGRQEIRVDGASITLANRKARALLAYLAAEHCHEVSREQLAAMFWGGTTDERARHNLRQAISKIRRICGPLLRSNGETLAIDSTHCHIDLAEFERLARSNDPQVLTDCLNLYRGEFVEGPQPGGLEFETWLRETRERLRVTACDIIDRLVAILLKQEQYTDAMAALHRRLLIDPAYEPAHQGLMELLVHTGQRSDALRQYHACTDALARELDAEPGLEIQALYESILKTGSEQAITPPGNATSSIISPTGEDLIPTVAILPFENLSGESDAYFADGIIEDITTALSCFHSLQVIARGSAFVYKDSRVPELEIAVALGARFLVCGSIQRAARNIRINVRLIDGVRGRNLWAHRYDRELEDVFEVQDDITATVVSTLAGRVEEAELRRVRTAPVGQLETYDILLRGKFHHHRFTAEDCRKCIEMFNQAIEQDPDYAVAHAWLACGLGQAMLFELDDNAHLVDQSQAAAERGLELDENESECHRVLAQVNLTRGNLQRSLWHQKRALFLNPNDDRSVCSMGEILTYAGQPIEGEAWVRKSIRLNPYHPQRYWTHLARALFHQRRYGEALSVLDQIGRPRIDDLAYSLAASVHFGEPARVERNRNSLHLARQGFDEKVFVDSLPYERVEDRELILDALLSPR